MFLDKSIGLLHHMSLIEDTQISQIYQAKYKDQEFRVELFDIQKTMQVKEISDCFWSKREILIVLQNENETIYKCYQQFEEDNQIAFIYKNYDQNYRESEKPLSLLSAQLYGAKLLQALSLLHSQNFIHREISPESLCFIKDKLKLKILNNPRKLFNSNSGCAKKIGVLGYMAPEIIEGFRYGIPADIFSCGIIIYEMLHGHIPFSSKSQQEFLNDCKNKNPPPFHYSITKPLENLIMKMLAFKPEQRISLNNIDLYTSLKTDYKFMRKFIIYFLGCLGSIIQDDNIEVSHQIYYIGFQLIKTQIEILKAIQNKINEKQENLEIEDQDFIIIQEVLILDYQKWIQTKMAYYIEKATKLQNLLEKDQKYNEVVSIDKPLTKQDQDAWISDFKDTCKNNEDLIPKEYVEQALKIISKLN